MNRIAHILGLSIALLGGCADLDDTSSVSQETNSWGGYHWARTTSSFTLKVGNNVSSAWSSYLNTTVSDWSKSTVVDLTQVAGAAKGRCRATAGRIEVCNSTYGNNGWLGIASISANGGHITQGTVKLNDTYMNRAQYNTPAWRNLVMCQEVGHTLGLDHQDDNFDNTPLGTCMDYSSDPAPNQHPDAHDFSELQTIYGHTDSSTTVGQSVASNGAAAGESPAEWGQLVSSTHNGLHETYVKKNGGDGVTITYVTWAR